MQKSLLLAILALLPALPAFAASDDAWTEFAAEVEQSCLEATSSMLKKPVVIADPFGSESYGLAIVSGEIDEGQTAAIICVVDKKTRAVQVGGELAIIVTPRS